MMGCWREITDQVFKTACELQQIPAPTFYEDRRADYALDGFRRMDLSDVARDDAGNAIARVPGAGTSRPLIVSAHLDSVFPLNFPLHLTKEGDRASGPGIGDNALGVAALLSIPALLSLIGSQPAGDLWLAATTGEEGLGDLRGIRALTSRFGTQAIGYVSIEGLGLGSILHRGLGSERYRVSVTTSGGHSWVDYGSPSAVHELAGLAARLASQRLSRKPRATFNIGLIQGGTSINTIASNAWMEVDLRCETNAGLAELNERFLRSIKDANRVNVVVRAEKIGSRPAAEISREHPLVRLAARALHEQGIIPRYDIASTEANEPLNKGYPAVTLGVTIGNHAHSDGEYIDISPIEKGLRQLAYLIANAWL